VATVADTRGDFLCKGLLSPPHWRVKTIKGEDKEVHIY
jgi:hypothetical protein